MEEKDWFYLQTVYQEKNISNAAQKLFTSQPALSYRLKQIEKQYKVQLFVRGKNSIRFTKEGEYLVEYAKRMMMENKKLIDQLEDLKKDVSGELRIGVSSSFADEGLPDLLKNFQNEFPKVRFNVYTAWSMDIFNRISNEEDHVGIIRGNYNWPFQKILIDEREVCVVSKIPVDLKELPDLPRIRHQSGPDTALIIDKWWNENFSQAPYISMEVGNLETCKKMVLKGLGYGILPMYLFSEEELSSEIYIYPLVKKDGLYVTRELGAYYREEDTALSTVNAFINFLKKKTGENEIVKNNLRDL